jgi:hypothetical protein
MTVKKKYPTEPLRPRKVYQASCVHWWPAIKLAFFPFLIATLCDVALAFAARYVTSMTEVYALKSASIVIAFYFVLMAFYFIHCYWSGDAFNWRKAVKMYSSRFLPALAVCSLIVLFAVILTFIGVFMMKLIQPYAHMLGQVAIPILIALVGLLAVMWVIACFYWPLYMIRDKERSVFAMRKSYAIAGLAKTVMVYLPVSAFFLTFLALDASLPWMHMFDVLWANLIVRFVLELVLGAWVLTITCIMMNQSDFIMVRIERDVFGKQQKKSEKKAKKKNKKG